MRNFLYTPLNTVKPITENIWIVDGPKIGFGIWPLRMTFSTRMTLIRLSGGKLWFIPRPLLRLILLERLTL